MNIFERFRSRIPTSAAVAATAVALGVSFGLAASPAVAGASPGNGDDSATVTICHATDSASNPWVQITVDENSILQGGHGNSGINVSDIIPPFTSVDGNYPGNNYSGLATWIGNGANKSFTATQTGESILAAGCTVVPTTPTPTTTTTTTTTPTTTTTTTDPSTPPPTGTPNDPPSSGNSTSGGSSSGNGSTPSSSAGPNDGGTIASTASPTGTAKDPVHQSGLAFTGADISGMVAAALALIGIGGVLILLSRNRRRVLND